MRRRFSTRAILVLALGLGAAVGGALVGLLVTGSSLDVEVRGRDAAHAEMDRIRRSFAEPPCLQRPPAPRAGARDWAEPAPQTVHLLAWEREDDRLVRVSTPYWSLRIGAFKLNAARLIAPPFEHLSLADLDRCGRGLVVDRTTAGGGRVLIWVE
jgi:hypothetical protein